MIYFIKNVISGNFKIGFSDSPKKRLRELQTGSADRLVLIRSLEGDKIKERELHARFAQYRLDGEWFSPGEAILNVISGDDKKGLVGKFFHAFENKKVTWQGLVQLFEWVLGEPSCQKLVQVENMVGWDFYDTAEEMNDTYESKWAKRD